MSNQLQDSVLKGKVQYIGLVDTCADFQFASQLFISEDVSFVLATKATCTTFVKVYVFFWGTVSLQTDWELTPQPGV